jgi:predicted small lipoprotein YifL
VPFRPSLPVLAAAAGAFLLAGCGVKGPLEPPPGTTPSPTAARTDSPVLNQSATTPGTSVTNTPTTVQSATENPSAAAPFARKGKKVRTRQGRVPISSPSERPDRPFILDSLL